MTGPLHVKKTSHLITPADIATYAASTKTPLEQLRAMVRDDSVLAKVWREALHRALYGEVPATFRGPRYQPQPWET
ncbi:hypothetical protein [Peterkaempfera sp. SMS 1(5)a]|uniref:hypothetical protein n=1 Tax=Peterkaempfera podocarpi TaxID=3232308 RepID=UPI0036734955